MNPVPVSRSFAPLPLPSVSRPKRHSALLRPFLANAAARHDEKHATWFAGGGGSSQGFKQAFGRDVDYALNHDAVALRMHEVNHSGAITWCADAMAASPLELEPDCALGSMWFSPDCTHHSKARGGAPKSERIRGLAWCVIPWAKLRRPRVILFENVEEWWGWGPLFPAGHPREGQADPARKGETRALWCKRMAQAGYTGEFRELVIADYGFETTRKRLFGIFRCDGEPIVWPQITHAPRAKAEKLGRKPYIGAHTFLDFTRDCPSIFMTQAEAKAAGKKIKRPLVAATKRRMFLGVKRHVVGAARPFLVSITHHGSERVYSADDPLRTVTCAHRGEFALGDAELRAAPYLFGCGGRRGQSPALGVEQPAPTMTGKADAWLATPFLTKFRAGSVGGSLEDPLPTVTANHFLKKPGGAVPLGVVAPVIVRTDNTGAKFSGVADPQTPLRTVTGAGGFAVSSAFLTRQFGTAIGRSLDDPHPTVMAEGSGGKSGVVVAALDRAYGGSLPQSVDDPLRTVTGNPHDSLIAAHLTTYYATGIGSDAADPIRTVTGEDRHGLVAAFLEQANTGSIGYGADEPLSTIVGKGCTQRLIQARLQAIGAEPGSRRAQVLEFLWEHAGAPTEDEWANPLATTEARLKFGYVILGDQVWEIADIGMRMLTVRELFCAQTFPRDYIIDRDIKGRPITGTAATLMCGNAVPPKMAALLYACNCNVAAAPEQRVAA